MGQSWFRQKGEERERERVRRRKAGRQAGRREGFVPLSAADGGSVTGKQTEWRQERRTLTGE